MTYFISLDENTLMVTGLYLDADGFASPPAGSIIITDAQAAILKGNFSVYKYENGALTLNPVIANANLKTELKRQIDALESSSMLPRPVREFMLAAAVERAAIDGSTEQQLYSVNLGYKKVKDFDVSIVALRTQMEAL